jgi:TolB protein
MDGMKECKILFAAILICSSSVMGGDIGIFEGESDVGSPAKAGGTSFDSAGGNYRISGGGENMWFARDDFHFLWKKMEGDFALSADVVFEGTGGNAHRKACLMIRQGLEPDAAYIDAALHGDGLTSLQFRDERGAPTREVQAAVNRPQRLRLLKRGKQVVMGLAGGDQELRCSGAAYNIDFNGPLYVGLGVCAHDNKALETAIFSNVELKPFESQGKAVVESTLEIVPIGSKDRRVVYHATNNFEAPNWSPDGKYLLFNQGGHIWRLDVNGGQPVMLNTGFAVRCNNDHGISPDGKQLVISDQTKAGKSMIYILPIEGGEPRQITQTGPSYWHGWSPDGKTLAFCGERNKEFDIYTISVESGEEYRLTTQKGLDDGPDYSPDGKYIYFNSERTGRMQVWRMRPDGSEHTQITKDEMNNWFPHPSPDGKWLVYLSYGAEVEGHPANKDVQLKLMSFEKGEAQVLAKLYGGQGTINVPSWSPDSKRVAFVSYHLAEK